MCGLFLALQCRVGVEVTDKLAVENQVDSSRTLIDKRE